jgi:hypothetical protein
MDLGITFAQKLRCTATYTNKGCEITMNIFGNCYKRSGIGPYVYTCSSSSREVGGYCQASRCEDCNAKDYVFLIYIHVPPPYELFLGMDTFQGWRLVEQLKE